MVRIDTYIPIFNFGDENWKIRRGKRDVGRDCFLFWFLPKCPFLQANLAFALIIAESILHIRESEE